MATHSLLQSQAHLRLSQHKGARRLWLEGKRLTSAGFVPGVRYQARIAGDCLALKLEASGDHVVSHKQTRPVIDVLTRALGDVERVEVSFTPGAVFVTVHPLDVAARERLVRLNARLADGCNLRLGSLSHGGGIASDALLRGLGNAELSFANDISREYLEQSLEHGALAHGGMSVEGDLRDIDPASLGTVEVIEAGLPCTAASRAGKAKKGLKVQEDEAALADLHLAFLEIVRACQPAVVVLENVPEYADSATAKTIRARLEYHGYVIHEAVVDGAAWSLEARQRWVLVAVTRGLDIDLALLVPNERPERLSSVLEASTPASAWRSLDGMQRKAARDATNGNGFSRGRRVLTGAATSVPTLRRGYQKGGSCDVRLAHPSQPGMARLFTAAEHARIKGIPPGLVSGLSEKKAHEVLGQSVISPAFVGLGKLIAQAAAA